eukprot:scaffold104785_cov12-Tisochrysis_lutea.AAC.1
MQLMRAHLLVQEGRKHKSSTSHQQKCTARMLKQKDSAGWQGRLDKAAAYNTNAKAKRCPSAADSVCSHAYAQ